MIDIISKVKNKARRFEAKNSNPIDKRFQMVEFIEEMLSDFKKCHDHEIYNIYVSNDTLGYFQCMDEYVSLSPSVIQHRPHNTRILDAQSEFEGLLVGTGGVSLDDTIADNLIELRADGKVYTLMIDIK